MNQFRSTGRTRRLGLLLSRPTCVLFGAFLWVILGVNLAWSQEEPTQEPENAQGDIGEDTGEEAEEAAPEQPPRYDSRAERDRDLLATRFPEEAQWLELPQEEALALYRPAESATPRGALLLLHSADNPPHWPTHLDNLRRALPRHGWATLALTLPPTENPEIPPRPEETLPQPAAAEEDEAEVEVEEGEEPSAEEEQPSAEEEEPLVDQEPLEEEEPLPPRSERIANHLDAALEWLQQEGQGNLIILMDSASAPDVMAHLAPQLPRTAPDEPPAAGESPMPAPIRAMILVSTRSGHELNRNQLDAVFAVPDLPVLDVILGPSARLQESLRQHRDASRRQRLNHYQQLQLRTPDIHDPENEATQWARRIHSYMLRQAEGVEVRVNR